MRLRTFIADTMTDAVAQVRAAMGDNAIIVSSLEGENGGFEVTAALDTRDTASGTPQPDSETSLEEILRDKLSANHARGNPAANDVTSPHPAERADDTHVTRQKLVHSGISFDETQLSEALADQGVPHMLASAIIADAQKVDTDDAVVALSSALETRFGFEDLPIASRHPIMLVGLPGSGKTVTVAKLAARAVIEGVQTEIIFTDTERTGATAQAEAYAELLKTKVSHAESVDAMGLLLDQRADRAAIEAADTREACFIDTAATNPFLPRNFMTLRRQIDAARLLAAAEPILVLAAGGDPRGMAEASEIFAKLGVRRMIVTQIDIARRLGSVLAAAEISGLAFSLASATPYLARGLTAASPGRLARLLLGKFAAPTHAPGPASELDAPLEAGVRKSK